MEGEGCGGVCFLGVEGGGVFFLGVGGCDGLATMGAVLSFGAGVCTMVRTVRCFLGRGGDLKGMITISKKRTWTASTRRTIFFKRGEDLLPIHPLFQATDCI